MGALPRSSGWPSKGARTQDGYFHTVESALAFRDIGDIKHDLTTPLRAFTHLLTTTWVGRVIAEPFGAQTDS